MLQLNHTSIKGNNGDILIDCTYRFNEGDRYVLHMNKEDYRVFFDCLSRYRKPEEGEITTWTDAVIYNMHSKDIFPMDLTVGEFLYQLSRINGAEHNLAEALDALPYIADKMEARISSLSEDEQGTLQAVTLSTIKPYITMWGGPFPKMSVIEKTIELIGEFNVYIFATDDIGEYNRMSQELSAIKLQIVNGNII